MDHRDIFTKRQCLIYFNSKQLGLMDDFVVVNMSGEEVEVVVTDLNLFCVRRKVMPSQFTPYFANLTACKFVVHADIILMTC